MKHRYLHLVSFCLCCLFLFVGCTAAPTADEEPTPAPPEPAQIKVMSWNILNPSWGGTPVDMRNDQMFTTIKRHLPDVVGLQEASTPWHESLAEFLAGYTPVCDKTATGKDNMTMFLYNTSTLTLIESGIEDLDPNSNIRVVSWAVFETKNGVRFLITNTHPDSREAECLKHTAQYLNIAKRLYNEKKLPLISVGDFNAVEKSAAYALSIEDGYTDSKYAEGVELVRDIDSYLYGDFGGIVTSGQGSRDHVFFKGAVKALRFETLGDETVTMVSDHLPVIADLEIG